jgi:NADP-dependent 3-hydroxy acid dehydrogenase YdfG
MQSDRKVIITGASSGIGMELAFLLAQHGYNVLALARRKDRLDSLFNDVPEITPMEFDVSKIDEIPGLINNTISSWGIPSILVNNAGLSVRSAIEEAPIPAVQNMFDVNFMGTLAFIQAVLPAMRNEKNGRIINVSSVVGRFAIPFNGIYSATKYAMEAISDCLRVELRPWNIRVILVEPGPVHTEFADTSEELSTPLLLAPESHYRPYYKKLVGNVESFNKRAVSAKFVARIILKAIENPNPKARYTAHWAASLFPALKNILPTRLLDYLLAKKFGIIT